MSKFHIQTDPKRKIKIVLADDHGVVRGGLQSLFKTSTDFIVVGEASNGEDAVAMTERLRPDVALLDISMPVMSGIEATRLIKQKVPATKVLILTIHDSDDFLDDVIQAGAEGYVLKHADKDQIFQAIRSVAASEPYFSQEVSRMLIQRFVKGRKEAGGQNTRIGQRLTRREMEILRMIAEGHTNREIAEKLFLSISTVNTHRTNLMRKLNIHETAGLVRFAIDHGLLKPDEVAHPDSDQKTKVS